VGIAIQGEDGTDVSELMRAADLALYDAKARGGDICSVFDEHLSAKAHLHDQLLLDLRGALARDELHLQFQPILNFDSGEPVAVEALLRWTHAQRGLISPTCFIPLAEESGSIREIGAWVLRQACRVGAKLPFHLKVCVNVSPTQVRGSTFIDDVDLALQASGLSAYRLVLEITESVFLDFEDTTLSKISLLRERGITISLDDFGVGYSSLSYLRKCPIDMMKIDRSFLQDIKSDSDREFFRALLTIGATLGISTTVEGVETLEQFSWLQAIGCRCVQGFLFGKPVTEPNLQDAIHEAAQRWTECSRLRCDEVGPKASSSSALIA
jgi:EAL domain-containing protein (putative c-di-GMP-specific phosphodiesterase class I)